jgi:hypothetical protein
MFAFLRMHGVVMKSERDNGSDLESPSIEYYLPNQNSEDPPGVDQLPIVLPGITAKNMVDFGKGGCHAATFFGPAALAADKNQNEDFALAGTIENASGPLTFGIVADGVSTKTFWPARASRIAAFTAYETLSDFVSRGWTPEKSDITEIRPLIVNLCSRLQDRFSVDRHDLLTSDSHPIGWNPELFTQHRDRKELWYQTTLLLTVLGPKGGWFIFCGDGGAVRILVEGHSVKESKTALQTGDTVELEAAVSMNVTPGLFTCRFIKPAPEGSSLHMILSSDGVDRSLAARGDGDRNSAYATLDLGSCESILATLRMIAEWPEADTDNMSLVHVCFPPGIAWPLVTAHSSAKPSSRTEDIRNTSVTGGITNRPPAGAALNRRDLNFRKGSIGIFGSGLLAAIVFCYSAVIVAPRQTISDWITSIKGPEASAPKSPPDPPVGSPNEPTPATQASSCLCADLSSATAADPWNQKWIDNTWAWRFRGVHAPDAQKLRTIFWPIWSRSSDIDCAGSMASMLGGFGSDASSAIDRSPSPNTKNSRH